MNEISDKNSMLLNDVIKNNFGSIETSGQLRDANQKVESDSKMDMLMRKFRDYSSCKFNVRSQIKKEFLAEAFGTFLFFSFSSASVAQFIFTGRSGFLTIPLSFGIGLTIGIMVSERISGGHLNPAVSFSMFLLGRLSFLKCVLYSIAQTVGAFLASLMVFLVYLNHINEYKEKEHQRKRDRFDPKRDFIKYVDQNFTMNFSNTPGCYSMELAPIFATYPKDSIGKWSTFSNFFDQFFSTSLFIIAILIITDKRNTRIPPQLTSVLIGVSLIAVGTSFGLRGFAVNPARDLGPRLFTLVAGWGVEPFLSHDYYFWIPIVGPMIGSIFGTILYSLFVSNLAFIENSMEELPYNAFN